MILMRKIIMKIKSQNTKFKFRIKKIGKQVNQRKKKKKKVKLILKMI